MMQRSTVSPESPVAARPKPRPRHLRHHPRRLVCNRIKRRDRQVQRVKAPTPRARVRHHRLDGLAVVRVGDRQAAAAVGRAVAAGAVAREGEGDDEGRVGVLVPARAEAALLVEEGREAGEEGRGGGGGRGDGILLGGGDNLRGGGGLLAWG